MQGPTDDALRVLHREAKDHLGAVVSAINDLDTKAQAIIRFNALVIGVLATGFSFLFRPDGPARPLSPYPTGLLIAGFGALAASTVLAVQSFLKRGVAVGLEARDIAEATTYSVDERNLLTEAVRAYARAIEDNALIEERAASQLHSSLQLITAGVVFLSAAAMGLLFQGGI